MGFDSDIRACARLVQRGDPVRFRSVMASPINLRPPLFVIYAFNLETSRAAWVSKEPAIAEIRLQWWHDTLEEIAIKQSLSSHEVVSPLATILSPQSAQNLKRLVSARRWDIYSEPFENAVSFDAYLYDTSTTLLAAAADSLGTAEISVVKNFGYAAGLARFFQAVPRLIAAGRQPLLSLHEADLSELAEMGLSRLREARRRRVAVSKQAGFAFLAGWQTGIILNLVRRSPQSVKTGLRPPSAVFNSISLSARALTGRW